MAQKRLYRGISFVNYKNNKTLVLSDVELVKQDILNHIFTKLGERRMMPSFGTTILDMPFEQLDDTLLLTIEEQILNVIEYDPRVEFKTDGLFSSGFSVTPIYDEHVVIVAVELNYIELDFSDTLHIRLEFNE